MRAPGGSSTWRALQRIKRQVGSAISRTRFPKGLAPARETMLAFLKEVEQQIRRRPAQDHPRGFSQGAMLSCDLMLRTTQPYAGLIQLSGTLLATQEWAPLLQKRKGLPVFQSHGMQDETPAVRWGRTVARHSYSCWTFG